MKLTFQGNQNTKIINIDKKNEYHVDRTGCTMLSLSLSIHPIESHYRYASFVVQQLKITITLKCIS